MRHINAYALGEAYENAKEMHFEEFMFECKCRRLAMLASQVDRSDWIDADHPWDDRDDLRTYEQLASDLMDKVNAGSKVHESRLKDLADEYAVRMADKEFA